MATCPGPLPWPMASYLPSGFREATLAPVASQEDA